MADCRLVNRQALVDVVDLDLDAIGAIEEAFAALSTRPVAMPPVLRLDVLADDAQTPCGEVDVKTAHIPGLDTFALKVSPGFFNNPAVGLPSLNGLMIVLSARTGLLEAILLDNGYLTDIRTAAAGGVAARHLSNPGSRRLAVIGTGCQARLQARAVTLVRPIDSIVVWGRDNRAAQACAGDISAATGIGTDTAPTVAEALSSADIVATTTPARSPLITPDMLRPGMHITAMGSDAEDKNELAPEVLAAATSLTCDRREQCARLGELHHALDAMAPSQTLPSTELGDITAGKVIGRRSSADITICDLTGTGIQDTAIARLALDRIKAAGLGMVMEL
jgi:ornithine cyclodeaminase